MFIQPTKQRKSKKRVYSFDVETYDRNRKFLLCSVYDGENNEIFFSREEVISFFKSISEHSFIVATNLLFDFFAVFPKDSMELKHFSLCFRGSELICAKTYLHDHNFSKSMKSHSDRKLEFIDTRNYDSSSVEELGNSLGLSKLEKPVFLGMKPKNKDEWEELIRYNKRDSEITYRALKFLFNAFEHLGASPKITIASTAKSLFTNKFLDKRYYRHDKALILEEFKAYYGGRVEAFYRGRIGRCHYYDFNSMYADVMRNAYPNPNTVRKNYINSVFYINNYEGVADVDIFCPEMEIPLLPFRKDDKLIFPVGDFRGYYSNVELRKALSLGYVIKKVYRNIYTKERCYPFRAYVEFVYGRRMEYKRRKSPMERVCKLLLNSLYGKFGQKFTDRDAWLPLPDTLEEFKKFDAYEVVGDFIRVKKDEEPKAFCIPLWALYTTAYSRIKLHEYMLRYPPIYCDTDSIMTESLISTSEELGEMKLEHHIRYGYVVKPKFYGFVSMNGKSRVKIKGIGKRLGFSMLRPLLRRRRIDYRKFVKFKEGVRRNFVINEIIDIVKEVALEDDKRIWPKLFDMDAQQYSHPIRLYEPKISLPTETKIII